MKTSLYAILMSSLLCGLLPFGGHAQAASDVLEIDHDPNGFLGFGDPEKSNPQEQLSYAKSLQEKGKLSAASREFTRLAKFWPDSPEAPSAQLEASRILEQQGELEDAFDSYKALLTRYPNYMPYDKILDRMLTIALDLMGNRKGRFLFFSGFNSPSRAVPLFRGLLEIAPEWARAAEVQYLIGQAYDADKMIEKALVAYSATQYGYPDSEFAEKAAFAKAYDLYILSEESPNDLYRAEEAWASLTYFLNTYPISDRIEEITTYRKSIYMKRAKAAYDQAVFYDRLAKKPKAALLAYRRFLQDFPQSRWTEEAEQRINEIRTNMEQTTDES